MNIRGINRIEYEYSIPFDWNWVQILKCICNALIDYSALEEYIGNRIAMSS